MKEFKKHKCAIGSIENSIERLTTVSRGNARLVHRLSLLGLTRRKARQPEDDFAYDK